MLLVPLRQHIMPRCFRNRQHLQELDGWQEEEAAPLSHEEALQVKQQMWNVLLKIDSHTLSSFDCA